MNRHTLMDNGIDQKAGMQGSVNERHELQLGETNLSDLHRLVDVLRSAQNV